MSNTSTIENLTLQLGQGKVRNVTYKNCTFTKCSRTVFENCTFVNCTINHDRYTKFKDCDISKDSTINSI